MFSPPPPKKNMKIFMIQQLHFWTKKNHKAGAVKWPGPVAWTKTPKIWVGAKDNMENDVSIPTECCPKISEFMKRNWPGAARI
jgi:hypothetical protein